MAEDDTASLRVFRAGFVPPLVDNTVTVTRLDKATTDFLQRGLHYYEDDDNDDNSDDDYYYDDYDTDDDDDDGDDDHKIFVAQQTTADNNCLFHSVSFALTGTRTSLISHTCISK